MKQTKRVLVIVAHPDDETIWMGGTLLKNKNWNTTILSLCRKNDKDRSPKFKQACKVYKAKAIISNLEDDKLYPIPVDKIIKKIKSLIKQKNYDHIFTHGEKGEYGHIRHIETHNAVKKMLDQQNLSCKKVFYFAYKKNRNAIVANRAADTFIKLKFDYSSMKKKLIRGVYGFDEGSFEDKACKDKEAFIVKKFK